MSEVSSSSYENYSHSLPEDQNYLIHVEENISGTNPLFFGSSVSYPQKTGSQSVGSYLRRLRTTST